MNAIIYLIMQFMFNILFIIAILYGVYHVAKRVIKQSVIEAMQDYDKASKMRMLEENALKRVQEFRRKYS